MPCLDDSPLLSSFDPAIHLHSEYPEPEHPLSLDATDLEALHQEQLDAIAAKTKAGIVIQHRSWRLADVFRSECDDRTKSSPLARHLVENIASSPPTMPFLGSSPIAYPASSSPAHDASRKRKRADDETRRSPLREVNNNAPRKLGPFVEDDSEDDEADNLLGNAKRRTYLAPKSLELDDLHDLPSANGQVHEEAELHDRDIGMLDSTEPRLIPNDSLTANRRLPITVKSSSGRKFYTSEKHAASRISYEALIAQRSEVVAGKAQQSYYGLNIHKLMDDATREAAELESRRTTPNHLPASDVAANSVPQGKTARTLMWTEKYRARKFTDLVGDERTHRSVLRWLKGWDNIVFPGSARFLPKPKAYGGGEAQEERMHRKILLLTGPPGLGKTTLAHVCARQAGYEVQEINASDERSSNVVRGRIRDMVGTENVRSVEAKSQDGSTRRAAKPVCVIIDEVDGVVSGSGGSGEGGFVKALIDLILLDQRNSKVGSTENGTSTTSNKKKKGDKFRMLRPLILICNDVYHPSLRPLRQSSMAEIIHMRKPAITVVATRMQSIFKREGIECDGDGVRRLCEATWGVSNHKEGAGSGTVEGDIRSIMVVAEWIAGRLRSTQGASARFTRQWFEESVLSDLAHGGGAARSLGRGGAKEVVDRVFVEGAGFPKTHALDKSAGGDTSGAVGVAEAQKRRAFDRLGEMVQASGDVDRIVTDMFTAFLNHPYQDDMFLSKPNSCHEWLHFHDMLSSQVFGSQEWELAPYLSQSTLAFHHLFACSATRSHLYSSNRPNAQNSFRKGRYDDAAATEEAEPAPFSGPSAPFQASEATKANTASISALQNSLSLQLARMYRSTDIVATELLPYVLRILTPDVKPVIINTGSKATSGGSGPTSTASVRKTSEKALVAGAVDAMIATGVRFDRTRVELEASGRPGQNNGGWIFRMEPALDVLGTYETRDGRDKTGEGVRYAVRQVLDAEYRSEVKKRESEARGRRGGVDMDQDSSEPGVEGAASVLTAIKPRAAKRDFFGRLIATIASDTNATGVVAEDTGTGTGGKGRIWCSFHEGLNRAVRKPVTLDEIIRGL